MAEVLSSGSVAGRDLLVLALPGVQRFISESRSTADVRAGSEIIARLVAVMATVCAQAADTELVFPSEAVPQSDEGEELSAGLPNRVVVLVPADTGAEIADQARIAVEKQWSDWVRRALKLPDKATVPDTPGMPALAWVCVPADADGYHAQWRRAQELMAARRRVRDFDAQVWHEQAICRLSPRWPALAQPPPGLPKHEADILSVGSWVKRRWRWVQHGLGGFPSTPSIASAGFRKAVLAHLDDQQVGNAVGGLRNAALGIYRADETPVPGLDVPEADPGLWFATSGGPWVYAARWQEESLARETGREVAEIRASVQQGRTAAIRLCKLMRDRHDVSGPTSYLAVIVADVDGMGAFLSGEGHSSAGDLITAVTAAEHARISVRLRRLAAKQRRTLERDELLGVPVYTGGDDLLAFASAATALDAARECHGLMPESLPTASTAIVYFHYQAGLRGALAIARSLLEEAKKLPGKHGLAVGYQRRSGGSEVSIQPWHTEGGGNAADRFALFAKDRSHPLSPRLVADLERDREELASLAEREVLYGKELARLVRRHIGGDAEGKAAAAAEAADALAVLGWGEAAPRQPGDTTGSGPRPERAARVGVFLRQEAR